jgi:hypothetical protein
MPMLMLASVASDADAARAAGIRKNFLCIHHGVKPRNDWKLSETVMKVLRKATLRLLFAGSYSYSAGQVREGFGGCLVGWHKADRWVSYVYILWGSGHCSPGVAHSGKHRSSVNRTSKRIRLRTGANVFLGLPEWEARKANLSYLYESCDHVRCRGTASTLA